MRTIVVIFCVLGSAFGAKDETPRKSRQILTSLVHPNAQPVFNFVHHPSSISPSIPYVDHSGHGLNLDHSSPIVPYLSLVHSAPHFPLQPTGVALHQPIQHVAGYPYPTYASHINSNVHIPPYNASGRAHLPPVHPVTEETIDYEQPTTPIYGVRSGSHSASHQTPRPSDHSIFGTPLIIPYHQPSGYTYNEHQNLASLAPASFPLTYSSSDQPSFINYHSSTYGSLGQSSRPYGLPQSPRPNVLPASQSGPSTPSPRISSAQSQASFLPTPSRPFNGFRPENQQQNTGGVDQAAAILSQSGEIRNDGSYNFGFQSANGIHSSQSGLIRPVGQQMAPSVRGSYSYTAPDGTPISAEYYADETGFHVQGAHIPSPPQAAADPSNSLAVTPRPSAQQQQQSLQERPGPSVETN